MRVFFCVVQWEEVKNFRHASPQRSQSQPPNPNGTRKLVSQASQLASILFGHVVQLYESHSLQPTPQLCPLSLLQLSFRPPQNHPIISCTLVQFCIKRCVPNWPAKENSSKPLSNFQSHINVLKETAGSLVHEFLNKLKKLLKWCSEIGYTAAQNAFRSLQLQLQTPLQKKSKETACRHHHHHLIITPR